MAGLLSYWISFGSLVRIPVGHLILALDKGYISQPFASRTSSNQPVCIKTDTHHWATFRSISFEPSWRRYSFVKRFLAGRKTRLGIFFNKLTAGSLFFAGIKFCIVWYIPHWSSPCFSSSIRRPIECLPVQRR